ncbi:muscarinic acetylcholine receptor M2-like [Mustelus asterias]
MMANSTEVNTSLSNPIHLFDGERGSSYKTFKVVLIVTVTVALSLVTIIGNILVIVSIKLNRQLQTINNYFLFSLACADLIIGVFSMNLYTTYIVMGYWSLGPVVCDLWIALDYFVSNVSGTNLLVISFDRYFCVTRPLSYPVKRTAKVAGMMIVAIWMVSFIIWVPSILCWQFIVGERTVSEGECYVQFLSNPTIIFGTAVATFYIPTLIIIILSVQIMRASKSRMKENKKVPEFSKGSILPSLMKGNRMDPNTNNIPGGANCLGHGILQNVKITGETITGNGSQEATRILNKSPCPSVVPSNHFRMDSPKLSSINAAGKFERGAECGTTTRIVPDVSSKNGNERNIRAEKKIIRIASTTAEKRKGAASREKKVTRTVLALLLASIITLSPYFVMVLIYTVSPSTVPDTAWTIGYWLCYINSTVNPACYALCNPIFKKTFKHLLVCQCRNISAIK